MRNKLVLAGAMVMATVIVGFWMYAYWGNMDYAGKIKHETDVWAVVEDSKGDVMALETLNQRVWDTLVSLHNNQTEMWIGGVVEKYDNYWGFCFRPDTTAVAEIAIEGAQSTIQGISSHLNYWINVWSKQTYVLTRVIEINE
jgi:hypothetical protein